MHLKAAQRQKQGWEDLIRAKCRYSRVQIFIDQWDAATGVISL